MLELIDGWSLIRFLHVLGAIFWVGGQLVLTLTVLPVLRVHLGADARSEIGREVGRRYAVAAFAIGLPVQVATGLALTAHRGVTLGSLSRAGYGATLTAKLILVVIAVGLAAGHGVAAARGDERASRGMALGALAASVLIIVFATAMAP